MRSFVKIKSSWIGEITLSLTDINKSRPCREFWTSQICVLTLFAKIKFSQKFTVPSSAFWGNNLIRAYSVFAFQSQLIKKTTFCGFSWVVTSTALGGLMNCVCILWWEHPKAQPIVVLEEWGIQSQFWQTSSAYFWGNRLIRVYLYTVLLFQG